MPESWKECEGQLVDGQFPLVQHLGGSDHSVVFLTQRGKGAPEKVAIKFVPADPATADAQLSRWKNAAQLSHPNLIKLYESGRCHLAGIDLLYVVMEHASENLAQFLPQRALSPAETRDMLEPFVETLSYLHGKGFVHGGIRPGNILAIDDQLKLSSDAIRRVGEDRIGKAPTDAYAPPEAALGQTSEAGDIWALGVTLIEALTQRVPEAASANASDAQQLSVPESLPQPFLDIARHSLQSKPQQRWTIADISQKLNPKAAPPPPPPPVIAKHSRGREADNAAKSTPKQAIPPKPVPIQSCVHRSVVRASLHCRTFVGSKTQALDHQVIAGKQPPARGYYLVVAVILALTVGAMLVIPRFRNPQTEAEPGASTSPSSARSSAVRALDSHKDRARISGKAAAEDRAETVGAQSNQPAQRSALSTLAKSGPRLGTDCERRSRQRARLLRQPTRPLPRLHHSSPRFRDPTRPR